MTVPAIRDYLRSVADPGGAADAALLARFVAARDEAAFELLVWRHAALVQRVCRAVLRDHHAAEDAVQAAFLVLARKAGTFAGRGSVVGWLYRVARRVAVRLAKQRARHPAPVPDLDRIPAKEPCPGPAADEVAALCAEVDRLPERYRVPVLLCFFEGLTHAEAARRTGWPVGTVAGRLARAKERLARRLTRRGVAVPVVALTAPAAGFVGPTAQAAAAFADRKAVVPLVDPSVLSLAEGAARAMTLTTLKLTAAAAAVVCALTAGAWGLVPSPAVSPAPDNAAAPVAATAAPAQQPPAADRPRMADAKQRARSTNNLKQIVLAFHNYHDANGSLPRDITVSDERGRVITTLSWRVAILPYLDQNELYKQFKLDEPWDGEHNKKLIAKMPAVYRVGFEPKGATKTYYQGFAGKRTVFEPDADIKLPAIPDGTSNTLGVVEAGPPVEWTKPADLPYDPQKPLPKLDGPFTNVLMGAMMDGSVHALKRNLGEKTMRLLIERDDGTPLPDGKDLHARFALTKEELAGVQKVLKQSEKAIAEIGDQLREQQKLLAELGKKQNPDQPVEGVDVERVGQMATQLEAALEHFKKQTEALKKEVEAAGKK
jgi:RNA polymerase sigma factor (sigma-70 family)